MLQAGGTSRASVLANGIVMALLVTVAAPIVARLPLLAVGVALAMVAVQMIIWNSWTTSGDRPTSRRPRQPKSRRHGDFGLSF